jgi:phage-related protein (TIGR01555 family)
MTRKQRKLAQLAARRVATPAEPKKAPGMDVSIEALLAMRHKPTRDPDAEFARRAAMFAPYEPMKGVLPSSVKGAKLAMDAGFDAGAAANMVLLGNVNAAFTEGYAFPGFSVLAEWSQVPEFRRPAEIYAREMTRKWIKLQATGDEDKTDKLKKIEAEFKRLNVQAVFRKAIEHDGRFGRGQIFIDTGIESAQLNPDELKTELAESSAKVGIGAIKRLTTVEANWSYPNRYNANDPLDPTFYKPITWFVMGKEVHSSRLLTLVSREVPDILKPAYAFAGLSLSQMMKPYVDNWLRTRQSVSDLIHAFTVWTLKTDMSNIMNAGGAESFFRRMQIFNLGRDNHGVNAINKETEEFDNVSAPLGSLDKLQAQSQEQQCAPAGLPLVYLTGITPAGLNASSKDEIEVCQDTFSANQEIFTPHLSKILNLVQLSLFGEIDPEIGFVWNPLKVVTEEQKAVARKAQTETDQINIESGVLFPEEVRKRIANEEDSPYASLDLDVDLPEPVTRGGEPGPNEEGLEAHETQPEPVNATAASAN